jgi:hypothetical protein
MGAVWPIGPAARRGADKLAAMIEVPPGIKALGPEAEQRVQALVRDAQRRQAEELQRALEHTLRTLPGPLRGVVRRVVGA